MNNPMAYAIGTVKELRNRIDELEAENRALREAIQHHREQELQALREAANIVLSDVMCSSDRDRDSYAEIRWSTVDKLQAALMGYYRPH